MNILADYHHGNLYYSFHLLFEKRLGYKLFRPIGYDWFTQGYWRIAEPYGNAQDTIGQYLDINDKKWDSYKNLNGNYKLKDDIYHIYDPENKFTHNAVTLDKFKEMKFDIILASYPLHKDWDRLLQYQPQAKLIAQLGNEGQTTDVRNVMCSTLDFTPNEYQKVIYYHQEFDLSDYKYIPPKNNKKISSFVVLLPQPEKFLQLKHDLPEFDLKAYGPGAIDGIIGDGKSIAKEMSDSAFGYHNKPMADGYGHIIHKWYASGRPAIINYEAYKTKLAGKLLIPDVTCISLDQPYDEVCRKIRFFSQPKEHKKMCEAAYARFKEVVDFDREAKEIAKFIKEII